MLEQAAGAGMSLLEDDTKLKVPKEFVLQSLKQKHGGCISETRGNWSYSDVIHLSLWGRTHWYHELLMWKNGLLLVVSIT